MSARLRSTQKPGPLQIAAILLLALAILCVVLALRASSNAADSYGPQAIAVVGNRVWLADERSLLITDEAGRLEEEKGFAALGINNISSIVPAGEAGVLVASRGSTSLKLLDARQAQSIREIKLAFPSDLQDPAHTALWLAVRPTGANGHFDLAVATGGNHTVVRFAHDGRFLARTKEGLYRFTNGIWFDQGSLWTTDTNRYVLRKLDPETLTQREELSLSGLGRQRYLGAGIASHGTANAAGQAPFATLIRLQSGMTIGRIVDVFADASEAAYPLPNEAEPMDIAWKGGELLAIDGATHRVARFNAQRQRLGDFGAPALQARFKASAKARALSEQMHTIWLVLAGVLLTFGLLLLLVQQRRGQTPGVVQPALPMPDKRAIRKLALSVFWPILVPLIILATLEIPPVTNAFNTAINEQLEQENLLPLAIFPAMLVLGLLLAVKQYTLVRRAIKDPAYEALFNYAALNWLNASMRWRNDMLIDEVPQEIAVVVRPRRGFLMLTNQRVLFYRQGVRAGSFDAGWPRTEITTAGIEDPEQLRGWRKRLQRYLGTQVVLYEEGSAISTLRLSHVVVARRMVERLNTEKNNPQPSAPSIAEIPHTSPHSSSPREYGPPAQQVIASLLIPGLGLWMQRRNGSALIYFFAAMVMIAFVIGPIVWALTTRHTDVSATRIQHAALSWLSIAVFCAGDTWLGRSKTLR
ncbi:hypothetical protein [Uliginosibacterium sediminicola]|uniref:Uncharacterized protein n=1 Tax=Uliginosibacterium sediminicola TaxID=2024550 RepID=A0ABU9YWQ2_9RHOO